jgi:hypothetical protein
LKSAETGVAISAVMAAKGEPLSLKVHTSPIAPQFIQFNEGRRSAVISSWDRRISALISAAADLASTSTQTL